MTILDEKQHSYLFLMLLILYPNTNEEKEERLKFIGLEILAFKDFHILPYFTLMSKFNVKYQFCVNLDAYCLGFT